MVGTADTEHARLRTLRTGRRRRARRPPRKPRSPDRGGPGRDHQCLPATLRTGSGSSRGPSRVSPFSARASSSRCGAACGGPPSGRGPRRRGCSRPRPLGRCAASRRGGRSFRRGRGRYAAGSTRRPYAGHVHLRRGELKQAALLRDRTSSARDLPATRRCSRPRSRCMRSSSGRSATRAQRWRRSRRSSKQRGGSPTGTGAASCRSSCGSRRRSSGAS